MSLEIDSFQKQTEQIVLQFLKARNFEDLILEEGIHELEKEVTGFEDDIQTDGHCPSLPCHRSAARLEELYIDIGARLAQMGDGLDQNINNNVVERFIHDINPQENGTITLSAIIDDLSSQRTAIEDMPQEKGKFALKRQHNHFLLDLVSQC
ncbi:uncharacterized protein [Narcine bancroftii]|uniref:uncharacterized protein isoform X2 n=1 Tax=Narcine bancroftii TaxID=1343680 RepID=UPI003831F54A